MEFSGHAEIIAMIVAISGLLGAYVRVSIGGIARRTEKLLERIDGIAERQAAVLATLQSINAQIEHIHMRTDLLDNRINRIISRSLEDDGG